MCVICLDIIKQKMSLTEAQRNLGEMVNDRRETVETLDHYYKLKEAIDDLHFDDLADILDEGSKDDDQRIVR